MDRLNLEQLELSFVMRKLRENPDREVKSLAIGMGASVSGSRTSCVIPSLQIPI